MSWKTMVQTPLLRQLTLLLRNSMFVTMVTKPHVRPSSTLCTQVIKKQDNSTKQLYSPLPVISIIHVFTPNIKGSRNNLRPITTVTGSNSYHQIYQKLHHFHVKHGTTNREAVTSYRMMSSLSEGIGPLLIHTTKFDIHGNYKTEVLKKTDLLNDYKLQPRDIRFSALSSLYVRQSSIILRLQHIKAIVNHDCVVLLDSDHAAIVDFLAELQERLQNTSEVLPFELRVMEALFMKMFLVMYDHLNKLHPSIIEVLNSLLDPRVFTVDRGQLHILLHHSKSLSEFYSLVKDIEETLTDVLDYEEDMAAMYLTHTVLTGEERSTDDTEEIGNILEGFLMQAGDMLSRVQQLKELIDQSESIILINLDSQRNIMLRLGLQLEMGTFSATICGLLGMAFGMNLDSSLEETPYAFWIVTGIMITSAGLLWRRLLTFLGKNLDRTLPKAHSKTKNLKTE